MMAATAPCAPKVRSALIRGHLNRGATMLSWCLPKGGEIMSKLVIAALAMVGLLFGCASMDSAGPPKPKKCSVTAVGAFDGAGSELALAAVLMGALLARRGGPGRRLH
jgi:hypothetical protein